MIKTLEDYFEELFAPTKITYGQIQEEDNQVNMNIYDTGKKPFFDDDRTHILTIKMFIRDTSFEKLQENNEVIGNSLCNQYDKIISNCHLVQIKKTGSQEPQRDMKNRYSITSTFEVLIEEV